MDINELLRQEKSLIFPHFDNDDAWMLGNLLVDKARAQGAKVAISIERAGQVIGELTDRKSVSSPMTIHR